MATDVELAYLAGYFDGEGCVGVYMRRSRTHPGSGFTVRVIVGACDPAPLLRFQAAFGGTVNAAMPHPTSLGKLMQHRWQCSGSRAITALRSMLPHLTTKRAQAEAALQIKLYWRGYKPTAEENTERALIAARIRTLKRISFAETSTREGDRVEVSI